MTQKTVKTKKRRRISVASVVLVVGIIVLLIPVFIFGYLIYNATSGTGAPSFGNRFNNDLTPAITKDQITVVETAFKAMPSVESVSVNLKSATLRINVDTVDTLDEAGVKTLTTNIYDTLQATLPTATYFTADETKKMYDLEISVFNFKDGKDKANYFYFIITKNANMEKWAIQEVSKPLNPALAQQLKDALNPPVVAPTGSTVHPFIQILRQEGTTPSFAL